MLVLMAILISTVPTVIPFLHRSNAQEPVASLESGGGVGQQLTIENIEKYIAVVSGIAEIGVVILLYKTVKDFAELAKVSKLQTEVRFRPWIGPSSGILRMAEKSDTDQYRYAISLKNLGRYLLLQLPHCQLFFLHYLQEKYLRKSLSVNLILGLFFQIWRKNIGSLSTPTRLASLLTVCPKSLLPYIFPIPM
jgi:hypothetical protein